MNIAPEIIALSDADLLQRLEFTSFEQGIASILNLLLAASPPLSLVNLETEDGGAKREFVHRVLLPKTGVFTLQQSGLFANWYLEVSAVQETIEFHNNRSNVRIRAVDYEGERLVPVTLLTDQAQYPDVFPLLETCLIVYRELPQLPFPGDVPDDR